MCANRAGLGGAIAHACYATLKQMLDQMTAEVIEVPAAYRSQVLAFSYTIPALELSVILDAIRGAQSEWDVPNGNL